MNESLALRTILLLAALSLLAASLLAAACGSDSSGSSITVVDAEFRTTPNDLGAGYLTITNDGDETVTLLGVSSPEIGRIELHETMMNDEGLMQMVERSEGFSVPPGESILLEAGGKHLMLFEPDIAGNEIELTLDFGSESIVVTAAFDEEGSASAAGQGEHGDDMESDDGSTSE